MATKTRYEIVTIRKGGKVYRDSVAAGQAAMFCFESMADAGFVTITSHGDENVYFDFADDSGSVHHGYCKCL